MTCISPAAYVSVVSKQKPVCVQVLPPTIENGELLSVSPGIVLESLKRRDRRAFSGRM